MGFGIMGFGILGFGIMGFDVMVFRCNGIRRNGRTRLHLFIRYAWALVENGPYPQFLPHQIG